MVNNAPILSSRFETALVYAHQLHARQRRKGTGVPYISHLMSVAALVLEDGGDEDEAIAALLHDAIEDQGGKATREMIRQKFGDRVVELVDGCTETDVQPKPPWQERKQQYLEHLRHAPPEVRRISLADKLHNARSLVRELQQDSDSVWERFNGGREGTLWFYDALLEIFKAKETSLMVEELEKAVEQIKRLG